MLPDPWSWQPTHFASEGNTSCIMSWEGTQLSKLTQLDQRDISYLVSSVIKTEKTSMKWGIHYSQCLPFRATTTCAEDLVPGKGKTVLADGKQRIKTLSFFPLCVHTTFCFIRLSTYKLFSILFSPLPTWKGGVIEWFDGHLVSSQGLPTPEQ